MRSTVYRTLTAQLHDAFDLLTRNIPLGFNETFPARCSDSSGHFPPFKIDHSLLSSQVKSRAAEVLELYGSDHYPLYVVVEP